MCKCTPEIKTPFCGKIGCEWPKQEGVKSMTKYRKKPVEIEAIQLCEENIPEIKKLKDVEIYVGGHFHNTPGKLL